VGKLAADAACLAASLMSRQDQRGNPVGSGSAPARDHAERALWRMMSFYEPPLADLDHAIAADEAWSLPYTMKAGFLLSLTEPALLPQAQVQLDAARLRAPGSPKRERVHLQAVEAVMQGRWSEACQLWDDLLLAHPRDALALQWAHLWDLHRGDTQGLRLRPARALPDWDKDDPLAAYVWGLYAFGLEESHLFGLAEDAGRHALQLNPRVPWAVHAVAHVLEMQGRLEEGSSWLRLHQPIWGEGNGFSTHLWWHKALFRLEALDTTGVLRLIDKHFQGAAMEVSLHRLDAASLFWRLHLLGQDMSAAFRDLLDCWLLEDGHAGHSCFNDLHVVMTMLGCGEVARAEAWVARCAERVLQPADAVRGNHAVARDTGLPLLRGLLAFARHEGEAAAQLLYPARINAIRCGGSHAQRDVIDQTLLAASAVAGGVTRTTIGRAVVNERLLTKPLTPLTRHWVDRLGFSARAGSPR
jgi:hypothetical protein